MTMRPVTESAVAAGSPPPVADAPGATIALDGLRGYFQSHRAGFDAHLTARLVSFLDATHDSLDCAIYDLRHPLILAALARLVARKVHVRIVYDGGKERAGGMSSDPKPSGTAKALADAGLSACATPVHEHGRHLMHSKFVIRDRRELWVGSANFTQGGLELQDNNCLEIDSPELAARFAAVFADLLGPHHRHSLAAATALAKTVASSGVIVGGATLRPLFAPEASEAIEQEMIDAIGKARRIRVLAFLLSDPGLLAALAPFAHDPHFDIRGVYDPHGMQDVLRYSQQDHNLFWFLKDPRFVAAPSHAFSTKHEQDFMHNKTLILDDHLVYTGSYNFSENAEANDEFVLAIESAPLAAAYTTYFDALHAAYAAHGGARPEAPQQQPSAGATHHAPMGGKRRATRAVAAPLASTRSTPVLDALFVLVGALTILVAIALVVMILLGTGVIHF